MGIAIPSIHHKWQLLHPPDRKTPKLEDAHITKYITILRRFGRALL
jgi:hypothetical protein